MPRTYGIRAMAVNAILAQGPYSFSKRHSFMKSMTLYELGRAGWLVGFRYSGFLVARSFGATGAELITCLAYSKACYERVCAVRSTVVQCVLCMPSFVLESILCDGLFCGSSRVNSNR